MYVRSGGTVPAVGMLRRAFGIRPLLLGFGPPGGNAHGPDEAMDVAGWAAAVKVSAALLCVLSGPIRGVPVPEAQRKDHHGKNRSFRREELPVHFEGGEQ